MISAKQNQVLLKVLHPDNIAALKDVNAFIGMVMAGSYFRQLFSGRPWEYSLYEKPYIVLSGSQFKLKKEVLDEITEKRKELKLLTDEGVGISELQYYPCSKRAILVCHQKWCKGESDAIRTHCAKVLLRDLTKHEYTQYDELLIGGITSAPRLINYYKTRNFNDTESVFKELSKYIDQI